MLVRSELRISAPAACTDSVPDVETNFVNHNVETRHYKLENTTLTRNDVDKPVKNAAVAAAGMHY